MSRNSKKKRDGKKAGKERWRRSCGQGRRQLLHTVGVFRTRRREHPVTVLASGQRR